MKFLHALGAFVARLRARVHANDVDGIFDLEEIGQTPSRRCAFLIG